MKSENLISVLAGRCEENVGVTFIGGSGQEDFLSYNNLYVAALKVLSVLQDSGLKPRDELIFQVNDNKAFIQIFWGCILGGIIPVPLSVGRNHDHRHKLFKVIPVLTNPYLVTSSDNFLSVTEFAEKNGLDDTLSILRDKFIDEANLLTSIALGKIVHAQPGDIAFIQFSSGSTGIPKGVVLTHQNLIANMRAISKAADYSAVDSMISWMPLTHDMGLIGFHLNPLFCGINHYLIPTQLFVRNPSIWFAKATQHKVSILCSPNFGYRYMLKHCHEPAQLGWDLSHVRVLYNGAEPISEKICAEFSTHYSRFGLPSYAMRPVYGLAEATLAVSISELDNEVMSVSLDRSNLNLGDRVIETDPASGVSFVNVGNPIDECSLRIADEDDLNLQDEYIGHVQIKGTNVTAGYYNNEFESRKIIRQGWLDTGDLGFIKDGSLYIVGRCKDVIFSNGQNFYPHDIERVAENVPGIELNKIAVAGYHNFETQQQDVVAFVLSRVPIDQFIPLAISLRTCINEYIGLDIGKILPVSDIPKTTSGKLQRFKLLEQFRAGKFMEVEKELELAWKAIEARDQAEEHHPINETEQKLLKIWRKVLGNESLNVLQNFFEVGGHSLKAAELSMMMVKEFGVELPLQTLYEKQNVRSIAAEMSTLERQNCIPIQTDSLQTIYSASSSQRRLYYKWATDELSIAYNIPFALRLDGVLDFRKMESSVRKLISLYDSLRMSFRLVNEPVFEVHNTVDFFLEIEPLNGSELNDKLKSLVQPFDLSSFPLFRIKVIRLAVDAHVLFFDFHHIIIDGVSIFKLVDTLFRIYYQKEVKQSRVGYKDFIAWERELLKSESLDLQKSYWRQQLSGNLPRLDMPLDFSRPPVFSEQGEKIEFRIPPELIIELRRFASENRCTLNVLMFVIYNVLLSKYTGQDEIIVGIATAGRRHPDLNDVVGMFVNNLPIRSVLGGDETFVQILDKIKRNFAAALKNQDCPFDELVSLVDEKRNVSRNPIFDTMFVYQDATLLDPLLNAEVRTSSYFFDPGFSKFDISMEIVEEADFMVCHIEYPSTLFKKETIVRLYDHYIHLSDSLMHSLHKPLSEVPLVTQKEYVHQVQVFNQTLEHFADLKAMHDLIADQVQKTPNDIAVEDEGVSITYHELNERANGISRFLKEKGISSGSVVGIFMARSHELVAAILGVLKSGACYLPLDVTLPQERMKYLISNSSSKIVITSKNFLHQIERTVPVETMPIEDIPTTTHPDDKLGNLSDLSDLAYVIYTSGTTGLPKGVMVEHRSLVNYIKWAASAYFQKNDRPCFPLFTSISVDLTVTSIFLPLITGGKIVVYRESNGVLIEDVVNDNKVTAVKLTPSHLKILTASRSVKFAGSRAKTFIVGGEILEKSVAYDTYRNFSPAVSIYNEYGPTEATVGCMIHKFQPNEIGDSVPIGIPIANTQIYVLDRFLKPVPYGVFGEIYISGEPLARGYLSDSALTSAKFINNPFSGSGKMYKTGDVARFLSNCVLEYFGRFDQQVKINGYRIELSEIENCLKQYPGMIQVVVTLISDKNSRENLCAYYKRSRAVSEVSLRKYLAGKLPHYMIPVFFVKIDQIPITANGKIDHKALPVPKRRRVSGKSLPAGVVETTLATVWKEVFGTDDIVITSNFFELGGDSIKAVQIVSQLQERNISLNVKDILLYHTIEQISLHAKAAESVSEYEQREIKGERNLTPIEAWLFSQRFKNYSHYNQSILLRLKRKVDPSLLGRSFERLIRHHDGLRVNYDFDRNVLFYNDVHLDVRFPVEVVVEGSLEEIGDRIKSKFDVTDNLLIKCAIIKDNIHSQLLIITAHHLVVDGVSWRILLNDLNYIYKSLESKYEVKLPRKTASGLDWSKALLKYSCSDELNHEKKFWSHVEQTAFKIPLDENIAEWNGRDLRRISDKLNEIDTGYLLKEAQIVSNTNVTVLLSTALALTLRQWTGMNEFVVEYENHGRHLQDVDVSRTVGWFTAMYPVRLELHGKSTNSCITDIKEQLNNVPNGGLGYGVLKYLNGQLGDSVKTSEIRFNYLGQFDHEVENELFSYVTASHGSEVDVANRMTAKLEFNLIAISGELVIEISYNCLAHKESTILKLKDLFFESLASILDDIRLLVATDSVSQTSDQPVLDRRELDILFY